ncbi:hypothetical protein DPMN_112293 [Dreissena polymorpha]|uniref:Uncharacterized protein n=1 Tax=Dreissena polymorpha TaxID=45954 RepID=A0A9D4QPL7_DREPO|nr:hypothetical protein DPMN_112293 [Dreissena polymorpha]
MAITMAINAQHIGHTNSYYEDISSDEDSLFMCIELDNITFDQTCKEIYTSLLD